MAGTMVHCGRILMVKLSQFILGLRQFTISVEDCESKVHKTIRCFGIAFKAIVDEEGAIRYARDQAGVAASFPFSSLSPLSPTHIALKWAPRRIAATSATASIRLQQASILPHLFISFPSCSYGYNRRWTVYLLYVAQERGN